MPTNRGDSDTVVEKWALVLALDRRRAVLHAGVLDVWRSWPEPRTEAQQREILMVVQFALYQLAECDAIEQSLKAK